MFPSRLVVVCIIPGAMPTARILPLVSRGRKPKGSSERAETLQVVGEIKYTPFPWMLRKCPRHLLADVCPELPEEQDCFLSTKASHRAWWLGLELQIVHGFLAWLLKCLVDLLMRVHFSSLDVLLAN